MVLIWWSLSWLLVGLPWGVLLTTDDWVPPPKMLDLIVLGCGLRIMSSELTQARLSTTGLVLIDCHALSIPFLITVCTSYVPLPQRKLRNKTASFLLILLWWDGVQSACLGFGTDGPDYCWGLWHLPAMTVSRLPHFLMAQSSPLKNTNQNTCYIFTTCQPLLKPAYLQ